MHHFKMLNWFLVSLLLHVGLSINVKTLSILEYSLSESKSTKCDLVVFGKDLLNDLHEEKELHHPLILSFNGSGTDAEYATTKTLNLLANCLVLFMSESSHSLNEVRHLAKRLQYSKPVGVVYEVKKDLSIYKVEEDQNWPFPIIFQYVNGMYHDNTASLTCTG